MRILMTMVVALVLTTPGLSGQAPPAGTLFRDVRVFDGVSATLSAPTNVLVRGNQIVAIGREVAGEGRWSWKAAGAR